MISLSSRISLFSFCLYDLCIDENEILNSPNLSLRVSICDSNCGGASFTHVGDPVFGAEMLGLEITAWSILSLVSI